MSTVLVLDDEPTLVKLVEAILKGNDYEVHAFTRAKDALSALEGELIPDAFVHAGDERVRVLLERSHL
jgi:CheY-like chemotaxis protein